MKAPFSIRAPSFDADAIHETIRSALTSAGLDTTTGPMLGVTEIIRRSLSAAQAPTRQGAAAANTSASISVIDVVARVVDVRHDPSGESARRPTMNEPHRSAGRFDSYEYANRAGTRAYKVYVPAGIGEAPPLVVMLHGCTQSADDFAAGTRMNRFADEHGFLVVYPEQAASANPSKCWSWFKAQDQVRDSGEPSLIAGIVRDVAARNGIDMRRIFVVGMSAGAAMAVVLGEVYPELFAGVGAHSGLPYRSASDVLSAMAVMKGGRSGIAGLNARRDAQTSAPSKLAQAVPIIVFHGDRDHTVQHANGLEIVQQARNAHSAADADGAMSESTERGTSPGGRSYSRTVHTDATGRPRIESWTVHGAGHAWAGGSASGTYTDAQGPDASAAMVRFFLSLAHVGAGAKMPEYGRSENADGL